MSILAKHAKLNDSHCMSVPNIDFHPKWPFCQKFPKKFKTKITMAFATIVQKSLSYLLFVLSRTGDDS